MKNEIGVAQLREITFKKHSPYSFQDIILIFYFVYRFMKNTAKPGGAGGRMDEFGKSGAAIIMPGLDATRFDCCPSL